MKVNRYKSGVTNQESEESSVLALARCGGAPFSQPNEIDLARLIDDINNRRIKIHIPWFWRHTVVSEFSLKYVNSLDTDALMDVVSQTEGKCLKRDVHWLEKVNLFHLYGLCRLKGTEPKFSKNISESASQQSLALSHLSAKNSELLVKGADAKDAIYCIDHMKSRKMIRIFAEYQLYYYGGIRAVMEKLEQYVGTSKESIVPTTVFALKHTFELDYEEEKFLSDRILSGISRDAQMLLKL